MIAGTRDRDRGRAPARARAAYLAMHVAAAGARAACSTSSRLHATAPAPPSTGPFRVLMVAMYPSHFTGTKYRLRKWAERLEHRGFEFELALAMRDPDADRLANDWSVRARGEFHLRMLSGRMATIQRARGFHTAVIHINDLPYWDQGPPFVAAALRRTAGRIVLDLDDLPLVSCQTELNAKARALGALADGLIVGNSAIAERYPGRPWWLVPTCLDPEEWAIPDRAGRVGPPLLGWVGTPGNLASLEPLAGALAAVCDRHGAKLRVVCSRPAGLPGVPEEFIQWSAPREQADLQPIDIGLAPLVDAPKQRYTCGLKALQYMAGATPVVASPVGPLPGIVREGETGVLASSPEEWERALDRLITDRGERLRMGLAARADVERRWSFAVHESTFEAALRGVPGSAP